MANGSFVWLELMTGDPAAAAAFYADVVSWDVAKSDVPGLDYTLAKIGERQVAGILGFPAETEAGPVMWFAYIAVADVDAMAQRVRDMGGAIHRPPTDIPEVGRFAVVADPQGAMFMLFRGSGTPAPELAANTPGAPGWHELHTSDPEAAFAFYQDLFGWEKSYANDMGPMGIYQTFSVGGAWTGGIMKDRGAARPYWLVYINVADIDAAAERVAQAGGTVLHGPLPVPGGNRVLMGRDPQGAMFALTSSARAA